MKLRLIYFGVFLLACQNNKTQHHYHSFENAKWNTDSIVIFDFDNIDTRFSYDAHLKIRHSVDYQFQNLFLFSEFNEKKDTLEVFLSEKNGKWLGKGFGDIKEVDALILKNIRFNNINKNSFSFEMAMRHNGLEKIIELEGILAIGVSLHRNE